MPTTLDTLTTGLADRVSLALAALDADAILAWVDYTVKARTARGEFLEGSTPGASRYHDAAHIRARKKKGLQTSRVDLFFDGTMLDATKGRPETFEDQVRLEYGYLDGLSDAEATKIALYHNTLGGSAGDKRVFIGLTEGERKKLVDLIAKDLLTHLS